MAEKKENWQLIGQLVGKLVALFTLIRNTFVEKRVGIEILGWLLADGKQAFVESLQALGDRYLQSQLWRTVDDHTIEVNLDAQLMLPFDGAAVEWPKSEAKLGWVTVERRSDDLYVGGRKVVLHLEEGQKTGTVVGHELRSALKSKDVLHPNVLDALFDNPHLISESWKQDEQGRIRFIYFWAVGFRGADGSLYVRYLYWNDGQWYRSDDWLGCQWGDQRPAALLAS